MANPALRKCRRRQWLHALQPGRPRHEDQLAGILLAVGALVVIGVQHFNLEPAARQQMLGLEAEQERIGEAMTTRSWRPRGRSRIDHFGILHLGEILAARDARVRARGGHRAW